MIAIAECVEDCHCTVYRQVTIAGSTVAVQGLMLLSPAVDVPRTLLLRIMEMLQGLVLPFFPHWRIVPSPPIDAVTEDPKLVSPPLTGCDMSKGTKFKILLERCHMVVNALGIKVIREQVKQCCHATRYSKQLSRTSIALGLCK